MTDNDDVFIGDGGHVFINGHEFERCDLLKSGSCDCADRYERIYGCCYACGAELDWNGECPDAWDHSE